MTWRTDAEEKQRSPASIAGRPLRSRQLPTIGCQPARTAILSGRALRGIPPIDKPGPLPNVLISAVVASASLRLRPLTATPAARIRRRSTRQRAFYRLHLHHTPKNPALASTTVCCNFVPVQSYDIRFPFENAAANYSPPTGFGSMIDPAASNQVSRHTLRFAASSSSGCICGYSRFERAFARPVVSTLSHATPYMCFCGRPTHEEDRSVRGRLLHSVRSAAKDR